MQAVMCVFLLLATGLCSFSLAATYHLFLYNSIPSRPILLDALLIVLFWMPIIIVFFKGPTNVHIGRESGENCTGKFDHWLAWSLVILILANIIIFSMISIQKPHGDWDARAIWNLHSRFLYRGMERWSDYLTPVLHWSHPDYPLLVPGAIARLWSVIGSELPLVPVSIAFCFTFATVGLLVSGVGSLMGRTQGLIAGTLLLGTPGFIFQGASQYVDIPLSFFYLAWTVLVSHCHRTEYKSHCLFLAFSMAGCAAWTKNEGVLFLLTVSIVYSVISISLDGRKEYARNLLFMVAGALPALVLLCIFKVHYAPANDILGNQSIAAIMNRITDIHRYIQIGRAFISELIRFNHGMFVFMVLVLFLTKPKLVMDRVTVIILSVLFLMIIGHFCVYLISPQNLNFHLGTSLNRIVMQFLPMFLFIYCSAFRWQKIFRVESVKA